MRQHKISAFRESLLSHGDSFIAIDDQASPWPAPKLQNAANYLIILQLSSLSQTWKFAQTARLVVLLISLLDLPTTAKYIWLEHTHSPSPLSSSSPRWRLHSFLPNPRFGSYCIKLQRTLQPLASFPYHHFGLWWLSRALLAAWSRLWLRNGLYPTPVWY